METNNIALRNERASAVGWLMIISLVICALSSVGCATTNQSALMQVFDVAVRFDAIERDLSAAQLENPALDVELWGAQRLASELGLPFDPNGDPRFAAIALIDYAAGVPGSVESVPFVDALVSRVPEAEPYENLLDRIVVRWRADVRGD